MSKETDEKIQELREEMNTRMDKMMRMLEDLHSAQKQRDQETRQRPARSDAPRKAPQEEKSLRVKILEADLADANDGLLCR